jgi:hypothetical protein
MITRPPLRRSDRRASAATVGLDARASLVRRLLTSGATALLLALCPLGAGLAMANDPSGTAGPSSSGIVSKEVYVDQVDRLCAAASSEINDVLDLVFPGAPYGDLPPHDRDVWVVERVAPIIRAEVAAARAVPPPEGDEDAVTAIFDAKERALAIVERDPAAFRQFGQGTLDDPFATPAQMAGDYGFSICALGSPEVD